MPGTVFNSTSLGVHLDYAFTQNPATIASGAIITNVTAGYSGDAVYGDPSYAWSVHNFGTAEGTQLGSSGIRLAAGGDVHNGSSSYTATRVAGDTYGVAIFGGAGTVINYGTIEGTNLASFSTGIYIEQAGTIVNGAVGAESALIAGYNGVRIGDIGEVTNYGTISGLAAAGHAVYLYGGGYVTNQSSGLITGGTGIGAGIGAGTVNNYGTIAGQNGLGVDLLAGGAVSNQLGGLITGYVAGIRIDGAAGSVVNFATIASGTGGGIYLQGGGNVTNLSTGRIDAYVNGIFINGGPGTVVNFGTIETTLAGGGSFSAELSSGTVINEATGAILAATGVSVEIGAAGTLVNYGTIANTGVDGYGVFLTAGGRVETGEFGAYDALISGYRGVEINGAAGILYNDGTIVGLGAGSYGARFGNGGDVHNGSAGLITGDYGVLVDGGNGTIINYGTIAGTSGGAYLESGVLQNGYLGGPGGLITGAHGVLSYQGITVINYGTILGTGASSYADSGIYFGDDGVVTNGALTQTALIQGYDGVRIAGAGTVTNYGTISGTHGSSHGVYLSSTGLIVNQSSGLITGQYAIGFGVAIATVVNAGTIAAIPLSGHAIGIEFASSGTVINSGLVHATGGNAVEIGNGAGTIDNSGTIVSYYGGGFTGYGVFLNAGGQVTNQVGALIFSDYAGGVGIDGGGTVINNGTISGDTAVSIDGGPALVQNYGTLAGTTGGGGHSDGVAIYLGGTVANSSLIDAPGGHGVYIYGSGGTVINSGTIVSGGPHYGVYLTAGGFVTNQAGGLIEAAGPGIHSKNALVVVTNLGTIVGYSAIDLTGATGTVVNSGTVAGTLHGVHLVAGGLVTNAAAGIITGYFAVNVLGAAGTVVNDGLIQRIGSGGAAGFLQSGGTVVNNATGTIAGPNYGNAVRIDTFAGLLVNDGTVQGGASGTDAVYFGAGGTVVNSGLIAGATDVVKIRVDGLVSNTGTIAATGDAAIWLADGGTVVNSGLVTSTYDVIFTGYTAGTVINSGTIIDTGIYGDGVCLDAGGIVSNSGAIVGGRVGVEADNDVATVTNLGTISATYGSSTGIWLKQGGIVINGDGGTPSALIAAGADGVVTGYGAVGAGTVTNYGTIVGPNVGVWLAAGGSLTNFGTIESLGGGDGVTADYAAGVVVNHVSGVIDADNQGVWLLASGIVFNDGVIRGGYDGFRVAGAAGTLVSDGTVEGTGGSGVVLGAGGLVINNIGGVIESYRAGVKVYSALGTVINYSTIGVTGAYSSAVYLHSGGSVYNHETGLIGGTADGIDIFGAAATVTNLGTVEGGRGGVFLAAGGTVANGTSGPGGAAIVGGNYGVALIYVGGDITNGTALLTDALIQGAKGIFSRDGATTVTNYGTIEGTTQAALYLNAGGAVTNGAAGSTVARIEGADGVVIGGAGGIVVNFGTVAATGVYGLGIFLGQGGTISNGVGTPSALIAGNRRGIQVYGTYGFVSNFGTVAASIGYTKAIALAAGGSVQNATTGLIEGGDGVAIDLAAGAVLNYGAIAGLNGAGVRLTSGGSVTNGPAGSITGAQVGIVLSGATGTVINGDGSSTGALIDGGIYGVFTGDAAAYVTNYGTITGTLGAGVFLHNGGTVTNAASATIGGANGVQVAYTYGRVANYGTVQAVYRGVYLAAGGVVINGLGGVIDAADGIGITGADPGTGAGTVVNLGTVNGTGTTGFAVILGQGGRVDNGSTAAAGASLLGTLSGITVYHAAGSVGNFGTIAASVYSAVNLLAGGSVTNQHTGLIRGGSNGVFIAGAAGTVVNLGSIDGVTGYGVVMASAGLIVNGYGPGEGSPIYDSTISGGVAGVLLLGGSETIVNYGTIVDAGYAGILTRAGGSIANNRLITGYHGVFVDSGGAGTIVNSGEISGTGSNGTGVNLLAGGAIDNSGTIAGGRNGVFFAAATSIVNHGLISGASLAGVYGYAGIVANYGTITGGSYGATLSGGSTLFNAGTVSGGGLSVYFSGGGNRLAIDPSAVFVGNVDAQISTGGDVLELAPGFGTLTGFGTGFIGFEAIEVDPGADWQVAGALTLDAGFLVTDAGALDFDNDLINNGTLEIETDAVLSFTGTVGGTGTIDFNGSNGVLVFGVPSVMTNSIIDFTPTNFIGFVGIGLAASYSYGGGVLRLNNSGGTAIAQVNLTTPVTNPHFTLIGSGSSTFVAVNAPTGTFTGTYFNGVVLNDPTVQNPALVTSTAFITNNYGSHSGDAVYGTSLAAWSLTNYGTITTNPAATSAAGVRLRGGGIVSNTAVISGGINGVVIDGGAGLVSNIGVILATDTASGAGISLLGGGTVFNSTGGTIGGFNNGVFVSGGLGTVINDGTILSSATAGGSAVYLGLGGAVTNLSGGLIGAYRSAVSIKGGAGQISNYGTIAHSSTLSPAVYLGAGGFVINGPGGLIFSPHRQAVVISGAIGAVTNSGTILNTATFAQTGTIQTGRYSAVVLNAGGVVNNAPNALIAGHTGIDFNNLFGTVINSGTVVQNDPIRYGAGVLMYGGGLVRNGSNSTALITAYNTGVQFSASSQGLGAGGPGTVVNSGTIAHIGSGTTGLAVYLGDGGIVVNYGLISGARAGTSGSYPGAVQINNQAGVVINLGTIANPNNSNGVNLLQGGILINGAGGYNAALIDAPHTAVYIGGTPGATGTVINYGTIRNTTSFANAVTIAAGGTAVNRGLISSARTGIAFTNTAGTIDNFGTIVSTAPLSGTRGAGVYLGAGGMITNEAGGLITAYRAAVSLAFFGTTTADSVITNYGVLSGATGISIGAGDTGNNTIVNFGTITGTNGIAILLGGGDDEIVLAASSQQLNGAVGNFQVGDTFDLPFLTFSGAETISLDPGNLLRINQSGTLVYSIQLDPSQSFATDEFGLTNDGTGGTLVVLGPDTTPPVTLQRVLAVDANSGPTAIGILAPVDPDDPPAALTVTVNALPSDGTVVLADGVTPVLAGQTLTIDQLTTLAFIPTPNVDGQSSTFNYSVSDPAGNTGLGTAFLGINLPLPPNSPALINGLGGAQGFGENALPINDDGSSSAIDITAVFGGGLNFFGNLYTSLYLNNNGNITFNAGLSAFTPGPITAGLSNPIIAAFWADVDTRGGPGVPTGGNATGSNRVYWDLDTVNHVFTATWDDVGYYFGHSDKLNAFQLRLIDQGGGDFDIELRYQAIYWTTGDASGGSGGLGGTVAHAGYSAGDGAPNSSYELPQSGDQDAMLGLPSDPAPAGTLGTTAETGVYLFQVRNSGILLPVLTGLVLSPASDSGKAGDNRTNDTTPTITGAGGISGDTVTLLANGAVVGTGAVAADGTWQVTASVLPDGVYGLTATQTGAGGTSAASAALLVTIDTSAPVTVPVSQTVQPDTGPAVIGIALPTDPDDDFSDPNQAPTIVVTTLPTNGTVTLGGVTPVSVGQQLTTSQLTALDFTPAAGQTGTTSSFNYTVTDLAGNTSTGTATFLIEPGLSGGRWVFSPDPASGFSGVVLGINNGIAPVFPTPQAGKLNFEVFTNSTVSALPGPGAGFQTTILDPAGTLENGFLTGTALQLGDGDFLAVDSVTGGSTQSPSKITLGTGNQTVVGARFDTIIGGSGNQVLSALAGDQTVVGGTGKDSIWRGANDSIVAGSGPDNQIVVIASGTTIIAGIAGNATMSLTTGDTVTALPGDQNVAISAASHVYIDLTGNTGFNGVIGSSGDTIIAGGGTTNVEGANGGMLIKVGAAGKTNVSGSGNPIAGGDTIIGGSGELNYNPSLVSGAGDLIDLSGSDGTAQINAFSFGVVRSFGRDTILGSNTADSVFGGDGDRIGTGNGPVVAGTHQWVHADTVAGTSVGFGSNDTVSSTTYDTVTGVATRGTVAGTSSAQVTVGGFNTTTDFIFYQNETAAANTAIVATSQATTVNGIASTTVVIPDGTVMTLVGVSQAQLTAALTAGTLFKL